MQLRRGLPLLPLLAALLSARPAEAPRRVVSLNLVTDHWLLQLAEPRQIAALTFLAHDPVYCPRWQEARRFPVLRGTAEEVLRLRPDLVLANRWGAVETVGMLRRLGVRVEVLDPPEDFESIAVQARQIGALLGQAVAGGAYADRLEVRLARVRAARPQVPVAVLEYAQNGWAHGAGSPFGRLIEEAGGRNLAAEHGVGWIGRVSLEELIRWRPEALIVPVAVAKVPSLGDDLLHHPVFARMTGRALAIVMPEGTTDFGGPHTIDGLEVLSAGLRSAMARRRE